MLINYASEVPDISHAMQCIPGILVMIHSVLRLRWNTSEVPDILCCSYRSVLWTRSNMNADCFFWGIIYPKIQIDGWYFIAIFLNVLHA
jgi:hypothetical protein